MRYRLCNTAGTSAIPGIADGEIDEEGLTSGFYLLFLEYPGNRVAKSTGNRPGVKE